MTDIFFVRAYRKLGNFLGVKFVKFTQIRQNLFSGTATYVLDDTPTIELATPLGHKEEVIMVHSFIGATRC